MLDFTKAQKRYMQIRMIDEKNILVRMPTKAVFGKLMAMEDLMKSLDLDNLETINQIYEIASEILSNNMKGELISDEYIAGLMDIEDIQMLMESYVQFCTGQANNPNLESPHSQTPEIVGKEDTTVLQSGND